MQTALATLRVDNAIWQPDSDCTMTITSTDGKQIAQTIVLVKPARGDDPYEYRKLEVKSEQMVELYEKILEPQNSVRKEQASEQYKVSHSTNLKEFDNQDTPIIR